MLQDDRLKALSDRMTSMYIELNDDINQRALATKVQELQQDLRRYALRGELEAFQQDCTPKLKFCVDSIKAMLVLMRNRARQTQHKVSQSCSRVGAFDDRLRAQDGAIARVDEVLLDKVISARILGAGCCHEASKYDLIVANARTITRVRARVRARAPCVCVCMRGTLTCASFELESVAFAEDRSVLSTRQSQRGVAATHGPSADQQPALGRLHCQRVRQAIQLLLRVRRFEKLKPPDYAPVFKVPRLSVPRICTGIASMQPYEDISAKIALKADKADL
eukprot:4718934-Amphidinium_carterae.1